MSDPAARARRITRPWRVVFLLGALAVTVGTHWPRLELPTSTPATDKTVHALAFGALTLALWHTGWIRGRAMLALIMTLWAVTDEQSQRIPILHRHVTGHDALANVLGVLIVVSWLWAMRPIGGPVNRLRLAFERHVNEDLLGSWRTWAVLAGVVVACIVPLALFWRWLRPTGTTIPTAIAAVIWVTVTGGLWRSLRRLAMRRQVGRRPCLACGASCRGIDFDDRGRGACSGCAATVHRGTWSQPGPPPPALQMHLSGGLVLLGVIIVGAVIGVVIFVLPWAYATLLDAGIGRSILPRIARGIGTTPPSLIRLIDAALLLGLGAVLTRVYRRRLARYYDSPWLCVRCGHDLRGTPVNQAIGRCGECGKRFVRMEDSAESNHSVNRGHGEGI
ncbi:MAG: VanZ family protein [Planctomycetota bacterium]|jgi:VanZ family protein